MWRAQPATLSVYSVHQPVVPGGSAGVQARGLEGCLGEAGWGGGAKETRKERETQTVISHGLRPNPALPQNVTTGPPNPELPFVTILQPRQASSYSQGPQPLSAAGVGASRESWAPGSRRAVRLACTGQAGQRKLGARCRLGCQGCRRPKRPPASPGADRPLPSLSAWLASSPHLRHPWRGLPKDSPQGFQLRTSRGRPGQVLTPQRLLTEPWPVLIEMSPPHPPPPPHPSTMGAKCKRFPEPWTEAGPEGASFQHLGLARGLQPDLAPSPSSMPLGPLGVCSLPALGLWTPQAPCHLTGVRLATLASSGGSQYPRPAIWPSSPSAFSGQSGKSNFLPEDCHWLETLLFPTRPNAWASVQG